MNLPEILLNIIKYRNNLVIENNKIITINQATHIYSIKLNN